MPQEEATGADIIWMEREDNAEVLFKGTSEAGRQWLRTFDWMEREDNAELLFQGTSEAELPWLWASANVRAGKWIGDSLSVQRRAAWRFVEFAKADGLIVTNQAFIVRGQSHAQVGASIADVARTNSADIEARHSGDDSVYTALTPTGRRWMEKNGSAHWGEWQGEHYFRLSHNWRLSLKIVDLMRADGLRVDEVFG